MRMDGDRGAECAVMMVSSTGVYKIVSGRGGSLGGEVPRSSPRYLSLWRMSGGCDMRSRDCKSDFLLEGVGGRHTGYEQIVVC